MDDLLVTLVLALLVIAVVVVVLVLPIVTLIISRGTSTRLAELQARIDRIEKTLGAHTIFPTEPERETPPAPEPVITPPQILNAYQLESIIGRRWVGWVAVILILFATAFFLKYAFDNRWIGEVERVSIGITFGILMCLGGYRYQQRGWRVFSQILTAGGIILLYLSTYTAFGYYHLVGQKTAFFYMIILIAEAAALSLVYNAPAIATMALIGGLLTPALLHTDQNQYRSFFMYLFVLDAGALALLKHWRGLSSIAYFGTQLLFWLWYNQHYLYEIRGPVLIFQGAIFLLFLLAHLARELIRREPETLEDTLLLLTNPFAFFATTYHLYNSTHHGWMGLFAIGMALVYASAATVLMARAMKSRREVLLFIAVALTFVTLAIPIQLHSNWITIAWAGYAAALAALGFVRRIAFARWAALALFALTIVKAMLVDIAELPQIYRIIVFFVLGILLLLVAWAYHRAFHSRD